MNCRKCSRFIPDDAVFCCYCGVKQEITRRSRRRANGTGTVFRYRNGWAIEYTDGWTTSGDTIRRVYRRKSGFKSAREAEEALLKLRDNADDESATSSRHIITKTVRELWDSYSSSELQKRGSSTRQAYEIAWRKRINGAIGDKHIDEVTLDDLNGIVASCTYDPAKDVRDLMSILFQRAIVDRQTTVNPTKLMTMPDQAPKEITPWLGSEITSLWTAWGSGERIAGYCLLMIYSGMMTGELLRLKEDMINWDDQQIIGCGLKTKKRKEMPILFPDIIEPILRELCATKSGKRGAEGYVMDVSERVFYERFAKMKSSLGIRSEVVPYSSRHSTGTELTLMGVDPAVIIDIMRHKNYTTTLKHYTKIPSSVLLDALNAMADHDRHIMSSHSVDSNDDSSNGSKMIVVDA